MTESAVLPAPCVGVVSASWSEARGPSPFPTLIHVETNTLPPYVFTGKPVVVAIAAMTPALYQPQSTDDVPTDDETEVPPDEEVVPLPPEPLPCYTELYSHAITRDSLFEGTYVSGQDLLQIPVGATSVRITAVVNNPTYGVQVGILTYPESQRDATEICSYNGLRTKAPENGPFEALTGVPLAEPVWTWTITPCALYYEVVFIPDPNTISTYNDSLASVMITLEWFCGVQVTPDGYLPAPNGPAFIAARQWPASEMIYGSVYALDSLVDDLGRIELPEEISPLTLRTLRVTVSPHTNGDPTVPHRVFMQTVVLWWVGDTSFPPSVSEDYVSAIGPLDNGAPDGTVIDTPALRIWQIPSGVTHFTLILIGAALDTDTEDYYDVAVEVFTAEPAAVTDPQPEMNILDPDQVVSFGVLNGAGDPIWGGFQSDKLLVAFKDPITETWQSIIDTFTGHVASSGLRLAFDLLVGSSSVPISRSGVIIGAVFDFQYSTWRETSFTPSYQVASGTLNTSWPYFFPHDFALDIDLSFESSVGISVVGAQGESLMSWANAPDQTPPQWYDLISVADQGNSAGIGMLIPQGPGLSEFNRPFQVVNMPTGLAHDVKYMFFTGGRGRTWATIVD